MSTSEAGRGAPAMVVLLTLAAGQFLMTLDSSVMNVSIATAEASLIEGPRSRTRLLDALCRF